MTKEEASKKWCPFARLANGLGNRNTSDEPLTRCLGPRCACWVLNTWDDGGRCGLTHAG